MEPYILAIVLWLLFSFSLDCIFGKRLKRTLARQDARLDKLEHGELERVVHAYLTEDKLRELIERFHKEHNVRLTKCETGQPITYYPTTFEFVVNEPEAK